MFIFFNAKSGMTDEGTVCAIFLLSSKCSQAVTFFETTFSPHVGACSVYKQAHCTREDLMI
jgi:hypothetical protein